MQEKFRNLFELDDIGYSIFSTWQRNLEDTLKEIDSGASQSLDSRFWLQKIIRYFFPYDFLLSSPFYIEDMQIATAYLQKAYHNKEETTIVIYADGDADGVSSAALLFLFLRDTVGYPEKNLLALTPRENDKYGIVDNVVDRIISGHPNLLITLDCGSMNKETISHIVKETDCDVIVLDHHHIPEKESEYPPGAFVNPKRLQFPKSQRDYCTATLVWQFARAFTYSFTPEMNKVHRVVHNDHIYDYKNGISIKYDEAVKPARTYNFNGQFHGQVNAEERFRYLAQKNAELYRLQSFLDKLPKEFEHGFHAGDKYTILKHFGMQKVYEKVGPLLPLSALGLVADLMPLWDDNRIILSKGLKKMKMMGDDMPIGLRELLRNLGVSRTTLSEQDLGFLVCPTINAAGRLGKSIEALNALIEKDPLVASQRSFGLKKLNQERKDLTKEAIRIIHENKLFPRAEQNIAIVYHPQVHAGISGLLATRLAEEFERPAIVLVNSGDALRGSIRSHANENVFGFLTSLSHFFVQYGGHRQAAGFTLEKNKLDIFRENASALSQTFFNKENSESIPETNLGPVIEINDTEIRGRLWQNFLRFAPYGVSNLHPTLKINLNSNVTISTMGKTKEHARLDFSGINEKNVEGVWFFHRQALDQFTNGSIKTIWAEPHMNLFAGKLKYQLKVKRVDKNLNIKK